MSKSKLTGVIILVLLMSMLLSFSGAIECYASGNGYWRYLGSQQRVEPQLTGSEKENKKFVRNSIQTAYSGDYQGKRYYYNTTFSWRFEKSMTALHPGDKMPVTGLLNYGSCSTDFYLPAHGVVSIYSELKTPEGFVPSGTHINVIELVLMPPGGQASKTGNIEVWQGQKGQYMAIYCTGSIKRGSSVKYIYEWVEGSDSPVSTNAGWDGNWSSKWGMMNFQVKGRTVSGTFAHKNGSFSGTLSADGRTITGRWGQAPTYKPTRDAGAFIFRLSADGRSFSGDWWYGFNTKRAADGTWTGNR